MDASIGAETLRVSASKKTCLYRARVLPVSAMLVSPAGTFAFHPIDAPRKQPILAYAVAR